MGTKQTLTLEPHVMNAIAAIEHARTLALTNGVIVSPLAFTTLDHNGPKPTQI